MDAFIREFRVAFRTLAREKGFATATILTLAVCIGANTAMFAIVNSILLKPLPFPDADSVVLTSNHYPKAGVSDGGQSSAGDYFDRRLGVTVVEDHAMFDLGDQTVESNGSPEQMRVMAATPSLFRLLRASPQLGRTFTEQEGEIGSADRVMLSHALWQQLFGGDKEVIGKKLRVSGNAVTIIGVMPPDFSFMDPQVRLWIALAFTPEQSKSHHANNWTNVGRLKPGATIEQAQAQVNAINAEQLDSNPEFKEILLNAGFHSKVTRLQDRLVSAVKPGLLLLWGGAVFLALIGAVNLASLTVARMHARRREFATRMAIGAGRGRLAMQLLTENVILALGGASLGILLGSVALPAFSSIGLDRLPRANEITLDIETGLYSFCLALLTAAIATAATFSQFFSTTLNALLREDSRGGTASRSAGIVRRGLVVVQVACAFVLLSGAGLLVASFQRLLDVDPGFQSQGVLTASLTLPRSRYSDSKDVRAFTTRALAALRALPGVEAAGATSMIPLGGDSSDSVIIPEGFTVKPGESLISPYMIRATPGYFEAMKARLAGGRWFEDRDTEAAKPVAIVDETLARRFWPNLDPIGRRMYRPSDGRDITKVDDKTVWITVVGVVKSMKLDNLAGDSNSAGAYYFPQDQFTGRFLTFAVRTKSPQTNLTSAIRETIRPLDPQLAMFDVRFMDERITMSLAGRKGGMLLAIGFGAIAVFLACLGIYGVLAYLVAQRKREIGIRMALGSTRGGIAKLMLNEGMILAGMGMAIGIAGAFGIRKLIAGQLFGVSALDPLVLVPVAVLFAVVALSACAAPVRRATQVDPSSVLHD